MFALCPSETTNPEECTATFHLPCLATHFLTHESTATTTNSGTTTTRPILPKSGTCPSCTAPIEWGAVIRGCYARRDAELDGILGAEKEALKLRKKEEAEARRREKAAGKKAGVVATQEGEESASDDAGVRDAVDDEDDLMRDDDSSGESESEDEPAPPPPPTAKTRKPAAAKARAKPAIARRGRGGARNSTTGRATKQADNVPAGRSGSDSEGTKLDREMMAMNDSE